MYNSADNKMMFNSMTNDSRIDLIHSWLSQVLGQNDIKLAPASADASFRRYFRATFNGQQRIVMDAPPTHEDCRPFIQVSAMLAAMGLNVPVVLEKDLEKGFLLLTDLGSLTYLQALAEADNNIALARTLYADAIHSLIVMQSCSADLAVLPDYDRTLLMQEMALFRDWYLGKHLQYALSEKENAVLDNAFALLADSALSQPQVMVHRDYHSRNLMFDAARPAQNPGILDFQDAVVGAVTYDLVSLLRDCYIVWPREQVKQWLEDYYKQARAAAVLDSSIRIEQFLVWFDWMGIQRHLKASGIFARLNYRDGKPGYLEDIPRTLNYIIDVAACYPELKPFHELVTRVSNMKKVAP